MFLPPSISVVDTRPLVTDIFSDPRGYPKTSTRWARATRLRSPSSNVGRDAGLYLQHGQIPHQVPAYYLPIEPGAIVQVHGDLFGIAYYVIVGKDKPLRVNNKA